MVELLTDVVLIVTGFQLLVLALVLLLRLPRRSLGRNLLAGFLLTKAALILRWSSLRFGLVEVAEAPGAYLVSCALFFLLAPLLYLAIRALCFSDFEIQPRAALHLVPFAAVAVLAGLVAAIEASGATTGSAVLDHVLVAGFWRIFWTANLVQILIYIVAMFRVVWRYRSLLGDVHSTMAQVDLGWLMALLTVISLHWAFVTARSMLALLSVRAGTLIAWLDLFSITIFLGFTTVLVIRGLAHARLFAGIEQEPARTGRQLDQAQLERETERLLACMETERPHLDAALTVDQLAGRLSLPPWQLSRLINSVFRQNFFHFVNSYRVREAKRRLEDPACNGDTMLRILHEAGFNSKSTFNDAFKRHTGLTPTEYRRRMQRPRVPVAAPARIELQQIH